MVQDRVEPQLMRLLVEILLVVGVSETAVMFLLPLLAPNVSEAMGAILDAGFLTFIAGPVLLWRFIRLARSTERTAQPNDPPQAVSHRSRWKSFVFSGSVFLIGCGLTGAALYFSRESERRLGQEKFDAQVDRLAADMVARFIQPIDGLNAIVGLYNTGAVVQQSMFGRFFQSVNSEETFPGVTTFGFIESGRRGPVSSADSLAIRHMVSLGDDAVLTGGGKELARLPVARAAMRAAAERGGPVLSSTLMLAQGSRVATVGAIYFRPAYAVLQGQHADPSGTVVAGFAFAAIHFEKLLRDVVREAGVASHFTVQDGPANGQGDVLFDSQSAVPGAPAARDGGRFNRVVEFDASGHIMTIRARSTGSFESALDTSKSILLGIVLMLVTLFGTMATWLLVRGRDRVLLNSLAIASNNARLVKAIQRSNSSVVITNARNQIEWANAAFTVISGYSLEESLGKNLAQLRNVEISDPRAFGRIRSAVRRGQDIRTEIRALSPQGVSYWLDADIQVLRDAQGRYAGFIAVETDISERKEYEKSLEDARTKAEAATQAKGQFLANMSHEIRTPMNAILGMLSLLNRTEMNRQQADYAGKIEAAARSLLNLINGILDFSKIDAGKMELDIRPFALQQVMHDLSVLLNANLAGKPINVRYEIDPELPPLVLGDSMRLQQVLVNLGGNAVKFTESGQVVVAIRTLERHAQLVRIQFSVTDSGIGIAPEHQTMIFDGFSQAETSTTRRFGGTGLGLSISKRLLGLMGSTLQLQSEVGEGSTFSFALEFRLPEGVTPPPEQLQTLPSARSKPLSGLHILVVDDNLINQQVAQELLLFEGARVELASDGRLALAAVQAAVPPFDAVLMDLQMPVMDGMEATRKIRQVPSLKDLPIIAVTANVQASDRAACIQAGMNEHVGKPFDLTELVNTLLRLCGRTQAQPNLPKQPDAAKGLPDGLLQDSSLAAALEVVDLGAALARMSGLQAAYLRSVQAFLGTLPAVITDLQAALQRQDLKLAVMQMHTLKGLAGTLGAKGLSLSAAHLEALCRQGAAPDAIAAEITALQQSLDASGSALRQICEKLASSRPPAPFGEPPDSTALRQPIDPGLKPEWIAQFASLQELLVASDLAALEHYAVWRARENSLQLPRLDALELALQGLDLEGARGHCEAILDHLQQA